MIYVLKGIKGLFLVRQCRESAKYETKGEFSMKNSRKITWFTQFSYGCGNLLGSGPLAITSA